MNVTYLLIDNRKETRGNKNVHHIKSKQIVKRRRKKKALDEQTKPGKLIFF